MIWKSKKTGKKKKFIFLLVIILALIMGGCRQKQQQVALVEKPSPQPEVAEERIPAPPVPKFTEIHIAGVGDIMVHGPQIRAQYDATSQQHNFDNNFKYVIDYLQSPDLMLGNLETTFGGAEKGYSSFPYFNTPDSLAHALKKAGFDALATSNNHSFDTGKTGIIRTLDILHKEGLKTFGTRKNKEEKSYSIVDVKGIRVGLSAYTFETPRNGNRKTINATIMPQEVTELIDTFSYEFLEEDLELIEERVKKMKDEGAEILVFYMHWGNEYKEKPNNYQRGIAQALSNYGVDIIFGSHPHVLQSMEILNSEKDDGETLVVYSMGNFLSNQRYEIMKNRATEDGVIVNIKMKKNLLDNEITLEEITYVPTWVNRYFVNGKAVFEILPTNDVIKNPKQYGITSENTLWRVSHSYESSLEVIESQRNLKEKKIFKGISRKVEK